MTINCLTYGIMYKASIMVLNRVLVFLEGGRMMTFFLTIKCILQLILQFYGIFVSKDAS